MAASGYATLVFIYFIDFAFPGVGLGYKKIGWKLFSSVEKSMLLYTSYLKINCSFSIFLFFPEISKVLNIKFITINIEQHGWHKYFKV